MTKKNVDKNFKDKLAKLDIAVKNLEKDHGKNTLNKGNKMLIKGIEKISTGSISLDKALGGGVAKGRIIELIGEESSGKSTVAQQIVAEVQAKGGSAVYIDGENAIDLVYSKAIGVNTDDWYLSQTNCAEVCYEVLAETIDAEADIIVIDSTNAFSPRAEIDGESGDALMGLTARLLSQALRKLTGKIASNGCTVVFISQSRDKIGAFGFGDKKQYGIGNALKFYASQRIKFARTGSNKQGDDIVSNKTEATVIKNKVAPPFKKGHFNIEFGIGIDKVGEIIDYAVDFKIIKKAGSWFSYNDEQLAQGKIAVTSFLNENEAMFTEIKQKVMDKINEMEAPELSEEEISKVKKSKDVVTEEKKEK